MVVTSKHRTHKVMEAAIRELMGAGTPPRFKFKDTYASIEFPTGYTIPAQATLEAKYDELLALEEGIQKMVMEGDLEVGTSNLFVDTETGNVGIGTTNPSLNLHVMGGIKTQNNGVLTPQIQFGSGANNTNGWLVRANVSDTYAGEFSIDRQDNSTTPNKFVIKNNGNVGIGTASPEQKLHIEDSANPGILIENTDGTLSLNQDIGSVIFKQNDNSSTGTGIIGKIRMSSVPANDGGNFYGEAANMIFSVGKFADDNANIDAVTIKNDGNVGIGTTSPSGSLHVQGSQSIFGNNGGGSGIVINDIPQARWKISTGGYALSFSKHSSTSDEYSTWSEKVRIDTNGDVGIGTASPGYKLHVNGSIYGSGVTTPYLTGHGYIAERSYTFNPTNNTTKYFLGWTNQDSMQISIRDSGWGHGGTLYATVYFQWGSTPSIVIHKQSGDYTFYYTYKNDRMYLWFNNSGNSNNNNIIHSIRMRTTVGAISTTEPGSTETYASTTIGSSAATELTTIRLCSTKDGNVGIGTASPGIVLDVGSSLSNPQIGRNYATGSVHDADKRDAIYFGRWDGTGRDFLGIKCRVDTHTALGYGDYSNQTKLEFYTWGNNYASSREVMCIRGDGNVGIGTASPSAKLHINTGATEGATFTKYETTGNGYGGIEFRGTRGNGTNGSTIGQISSYWQNNTRGSIIFNDGGDISILPTRNVGIGTASPTAKLQVNYTEGTLSDFSYGAGTTHWYGKGLGLNGGNGGFLYAHDINHAIFLRQSPFSTSDHNAYCNYGYHAFYTNGYIQNQTEKMRIAQNGNVGMGTSAPTYKLHVLDSDNSVAIFGPNTTWASYLVVGAGSNKTAANNTAIAQCISTNGNLHLDAGHARDIYMNHYSGYYIRHGGSGLYSDDRLKSEEELITNATDTLLKLSPQKYLKKRTLREDEHREPVIETGLIAQDIWYDAPELRHIVLLGADADPTENKPEAPVDGDIQQDPDYSSWGPNEASVNYDGLIAYLVKSNQELHGEIQALKARIAALENA